MVETRRRGRRRFGSVRQRASGRWQATYWYEGRLQTAPKTFTRKGDALAWLSTVEADLLRGRWANPRAGSIPFRDYAEAWLGRRDLRDTTRAKYRGLLDLHILPTFGGRPLNQVKTADVARWNEDLGRRHQATAAGAYRLLATIYNSALREELVVRTPCKVVGGGRERSEERPIAAVADVQAAVDATPENYRTALLLAAWCQLRRGEILALRRKDVDLAKGSVRVEMTWALTQAGRAVLGHPKTDAGRRTVYLPAPALEAVTDHLERFVGPKPEAWLFPGSGSEPVHPRTFARVWARAREAAGRPDLRLHDLRHSGLTWAAQTGATVAELMRQAGHASPAAAIRYQHAADERSKALADALGRMAESSRP